jgi:NADH-quinone oxidoreductase subunit F
VVIRTYFKVPTYVTIRDVHLLVWVEAIVGGKNFKAVQIGGTSGGFFPEQLLDTPIDFDSMAKIGGNPGNRSCVCHG